jgi:hypothetical protein
MRRVAALAGLATVIVAGALAGCGGGGDGDDRGGRANDPFYGVISAEPLPGGPMLARLGDAGIGTLRVNLAWAYVQSGPDAPNDWTHYDPVVEDAARNGLRVLATVYGSPAWAAPSPEYPPLGDSLPGFQAFVKAAVGRYGPGGSFWSQHPDLPELPVTDWQLWNEPNFPLFWKPAPDAGDYLTLLRAFHTAVKGVAPSASVLLGGLFPSPAGGIPLDQFLGDLYRRGGRRDFDAVGIHPYAGTSAEVIERVAEARALMRRFADPDKPIWITEVGWASGGAPSGLTVSPARQAVNLAGTFERAADARDRLGIAGMVWYALSDTPGTPWPAHCGLFTVDGTPKPSWREFAELAGGSG